MTAPLRGGVNDIRFRLTGRRSLFTFFVCPSFVRRAFHLVSGRASEYSRSITKRLENRILFDHPVHDRTVAMTV